MALVAFIPDDDGPVRRQKRLSLNLDCQEEEIPELEIDVDEHGK